MHTHSATRIYAGDPGAQSVGGFPCSKRRRGGLSVPRSTLPCCPSHIDRETGETGVITAVIRSKRVDKVEIQQVEVQIKSRRETFQDRMEKS